MNCGWRFGSSSWSEEYLTGDTICEEGSPIILESLYIPEPVISVAVNRKLSRIWKSFPKHSNPYQKKTHLPRQR
jgi:hypothetical protein